MPKAKKKATSKKAAKKTTKSVRKKNRDIEIEVVHSEASGKSLYVNGYRVLGEKPWGVRIYTWTENASTFLKDIRHALTLGEREAKEQGWRVECGTAKK